MPAGPSVVGRDHELDVLHAHLDRGAAAAGPGLLLTGPVAAGRTALLDVLAAGRAVRRARWTGDGGRTLAPLVTVLTGRGRAGRWPSSPVSAVERVAGLVAREGPDLVVLLDDAQLAPAADLRALRLLLARTAGMPWRVVVTARTGDLDGLRWPAPDHLARHCAVLDLPELDRTASAAVLARGWGAAPSAALVDAVRDALGPLAGRPGTLVEAGAALRADGAIVQVAGRVHLRAGATVRLPPTSAVLRALAPRAAGEPRLLGLVAALGGIAPGETPTLAEHLGTPTAAVSGVLADLRAAGFPGTDDAPLAPALARAAAAGVADEEVRAAASAVIADALSSTTAADLTGLDLARIADLLSAAAPGRVPAHLADAVLALSRSALHAEPARVARWCAVLAEASGPPTALDALAHHVAACSLAGDWEGCAAAARVLLARAASDRHRAAARAGLAAALAALGEQGEPGSADVTVLTATRARILVTAGDLAAAAALLDAHEGGGRTVRAGRALVAALTGRSDRLGGTRRPERGRAVLALAFGDLGTAERLLLPGGPVVGGAAERYRMVRAAFHAGNWDEVLAAADGAAPTGRAAGPARGAEAGADGASRALAAEVMRLRGDLAAALAWLAGLDPHGPFGHVPAWSMAGVLAAGGDRAAALGVLDGAVAAGRARGHVLGLELPLSRAVALAGPAAGDRAAALARHVRSTGAAHARLLHLLAVPTPDPRPAQRLARALDLPFESATAAVLAAEAGGSGAGLEAALARFRRLGASGWADRCVALLDRPGAPGSAPSRSDVVLTARDRAVLDLVVAGRTNRDIAARLGIGEKTVERSVSRLLRAHGVRKRAALAAVR